MLSGYHVGTSKTLHMTKHTKFVVRTKSPLKMLDAHCLKNVLQTLFCVQIHCKLKDETNFCTLLYAKVCKFLRFH